MKPVILLGGGGHARVVASTISATGRRVLGFVDPEKDDAAITGLQRLGDDNAVFEYEPSTILLAHGIGSTRPGPHRMAIFERFKSAGYTFLTLIHPAASVASDVRLGEGCAVFAGAVIQPGVRIGCNTIVNTRASIDHDCSIGSHAHIAPGAVVCGAVSIGDGSHIGAGSTVIQNVTIGARALVGAGSVVLRNVPADARVFGNPCRLLPPEGH
jgi:sugar O-acyltransferase (sialic acid O-acetyltransferase NeuD family)